MVLNICIPILINIILMLVLTLIIAAMTLIERKILSLMQRRVGPQFVGYKGRLQYIADALKLFLKGALIPEEANKFFFVTMPAVVAAICYSFWMNAVWGPSISIFEIEFNIVYASLFSALFTLCIILTGYFSKNKYSMLGAIRAGIGMLNLELFLGLLFLNIVLISESFSFLSVVTYQEIYWLIIMFASMLGIIIITFLLEVNRAPFDLSEAESELVSGYMTEYGGFFFGVYYLGEYLHLYFFSILLATLFLGGWELPYFLKIILMNLYDHLSFFYIEDKYKKYMYGDWLYYLEKSSWKLNQLYLNFFYNYNYEFILNKFNNK